MFKRSGSIPEGAGEPTWMSRLAARAVTSPFAFFVSWTIDLAILLRELRRQRRHSAREAPAKPERQ